MVVVALVAFRVTMLEKASELVKFSAYGVDAEFQRERAAKARTALSESALGDALEDADHPEGGTVVRGEEGADLEPTNASEKVSAEPTNGTEEEPPAEPDADAQEAHPDRESEKVQPLDQYNFERMLSDGAATSAASEAKRRASIEAAFKEGAAWGYDMAGIGFRSRPVPVIQWTADSRPEILYGQGSAPPDGKMLGETSEGVARAKDRYTAQRLNSIRRLEQEIRELEIEEGNRILSGAAWRAWRGTWGGPN